MQSRRIILFLFLRNKNKNNIKHRRKIPRFNYNDIRRITQLKKTTHTTFLNLCEQIMNP